MIGCTGVRLCNVCNYRTETEFFTKGKAMSKWTATRKAAWAVKPAEMFAKWNGVNELRDRIAKINARHRETQGRRRQAA